MYVIEYDAKNLAIVKYEDEMAIPTIAVNMRRARIGAEADLEGMDGDLLLRVHNALSGKTDDALPPDPAHAVWGLLEAVSSFPIEVGDEDRPVAPPTKKAAKRNKKKLQATNASTTSVQPDNSSDDGGKNMATKSNGKGGKGKGKAAAKVAKPKKAAGAKTGPRGEKVLKVKALLERKSGCTANDVKAATGWPSVSMPAMAKACGLKLRSEKVASTKDVRAHTRYYGEA